MFKGRSLLIATKHEKEKVIAPILEKELGVKCFVAQNFDSDELGTFTGEIERKEDPISTARMKCLMSMELNSSDLVIASEGSFGPHPTLFFVASDEEFLLLLDKRNNLEIVVRHLSTETNFSASEIGSNKELENFVQMVGFPSHGVILRPSKDDYTSIHKGIIDWNELLALYAHYSQQYGTCYIETDMRALFNPRRMSVIEKTTTKLVEKINSICPQCQTPGFGITDAIQGLPCALCGFPTSSVMSYRYTCQQCLYEKEEKYPKGKQNEDPMYCDMCNP